MATKETYRYSLKVSNCSFTITSFCLSSLCLRLSISSRQCTSFVPERMLSAAPAPQILSTRLSCGLTAYCTLWRAGGPGGAGRRPTVLHVYGGPEVQTVTNSYRVSERGRPYCTL